MNCSREEAKLDSELCSLLKRFAKLDTTAYKEHTPRWSRWCLATLQGTMATALNRKRNTQHELQHREADVLTAIRALEAFGRFLEEIVIDETISKDDNMLDQQLTIAQTLGDVLDLLIQRCIKFRQEQGLAEYETGSIEKIQTVKEHVNRLTNVLKTHRNVSHVIQEQAEAELADAIHVSSHNNHGMNGYILIVGSHLPSDRNSLSCVKALRAFQFVIEQSEVVLGKDINIQLAYLDAALVRGHATITAAQKDFERFQSGLAHLRLEVSDQFDQIDLEMDRLEMEGDMPWNGRDALGERRLCLATLSSTLYSIRLTHMLVQKARRIKWKVAERREEEETIMRLKRKRQRDDMEEAQRKDSTARKEQDRKHH